MLTVKQLLAIETQSSVPPWRASALRKKFGAGTLLLRSVISEVQARKVFFSVQVRDSSLVKSASNLAQLKALWKTSIPSRATLVHFSQLVASAGGVVNFVSKDWQTVGFSGTTGPLAGGPPLVLMDETNYGAIMNIIGGAANVVFGIIAIASSPSAGPGALYVAGSGLALADLGEAQIELSLFQLGVIEPSIQPGDFAVTTIGEVTIYGELPADQPSENVITMPTVEINDLPDQPPAPPESDPLVPPEPPPPELPSP